MSAESTPPMSVINTGERLYASSNIQRSHCKQFMKYFQWYSDDHKSMRIAVGFFVLMTALKSIQVLYVSSYVALLKTQEFQCHSLHNVHVA
jgi:hypothetical protein